VLWRFSQAVRGGLVGITGCGQREGSPRFGGSSQGFRDDKRELGLTGRLQMCNVHLMP